MPPRKSKPSSTTIGGGLIGGGDGFDEAPQAFKHQTVADVRFDESIELMRSFSRIENANARREVIALARRFADEPSDDRGEN